MTISELTVRAAFGTISRLLKAEDCILRESLTEAENECY